MADTKLTALDAIDTVEATDLIYVVDDPSGTPLSKKATRAQVSPWEVIAQTVVSSPVAAVEHEFDPTAFLEVVHYQFQVESGTPGTGASFWSFDILTSGDDPVLQLEQYLQGSVFQAKITYASLGQTQSDFSAIGALGVSSETADGSAGFIGAEETFDLSNGPAAKFVTYFLDEAPDPVNIIAGTFITYGLRRPS